jgi:hypothetical protein
LTNIFYIGFFVALSLPVYFTAKYLEKKLIPRQGFVKFLLWLLLVLVIISVYYIGMMTLIIRLIGLRNLH